MYNLSNNQEKSDIFDYSRNIIIYRGQEYPFRSLCYNDYNGEVIISTTSLNNEVFDKHGFWVDSLAEYIDNKIAFYVGEDEITKSNEYLQTILKNNIS